MNAKDKIKALEVLKKIYSFYFGVLKEMKEQEDEKQVENVWENFQIAVTYPKGKLWFGFWFILFFFFSFEKWNKCVK